MLFKKCFPSFYILMSLSSFIGISAMAQEGEERAFSLKAFSEISHRDNLYSTRGSKDSSTISSIGTKFGFQNTGLLQFSVVGMVREDHYSHESELNHTAYRVSPTLIYDQGRYQVTIKGSSSYDISPSSNEEAALYGNLRQVKTFNHSASADVDYQINERFGVVIAGDWQQKDYIDYDRPLDYDRFTFAVSPYQRLNENLRIGVRTGVTANFYKQNNNGIGDSKRYFFNGFGTYKLDDKLSAHVEAGWAMTDYDDAESFTGFNMSTSLTYKYSDKLSFNSRISVLYDDSIAGYSNYSETRIKQTTTLSTGCSWKILPNLAWNNQITYSLNDEKNSIVDNCDFQYSSQFLYMMNKHISFYGGYTYKNVNYDHLNADFNQNIIKIGAEFTF